MARTIEDYKALFDTKLAAHSWILCADVAAAFTAFMPVFAEIGAPKPLLLAGSEGTGDLPDPDSCELIVLGTSSDTMLGGIRAYHEALRALPDWAMERIEAWDPEGQALVLPSFLDTELEIGGRSSWGARPEEWLALEDKMIIDALWDAAGVPRAPSKIVGNTAEELTQASRHLDSGSGIVWTADNRDGWHGGAEYSRYITDLDDAAAATEFMTDHAHRVRVMPFLEGVPCAIHGLVFPTEVAVFRPVEMVVFRQPGSDRFRYASCSTSWDPHPEMRDEMRQVAKRVGAYLRTNHGFAGAFTVDGVATSEGFLPTELNPRYGAGIGAVGRAAGLPLLGLSRMLIEGEGDDLDALEIERLVTEGADGTRILGGFTMTPIPRTETEELRVHWTGDSVIAGSNDANATLTRGPATHGSMVRFMLDGDATPAGTLAAPIVRAGFELADELWQTGIGELIYATEV